MGKTIQNKENTAAIHFQCKSNAKLIAAFVRIVIFEAIARKGTR